MAGGKTFLINFEGNASGAVAAIGQVGSAIGRLGSAFGAAATKADVLGNKMQKVMTSGTGGGMSGAAARLAQSYDQAIAKVDVLQKKIASLNAQKTARASTAVDVEGRLSKVNAEIAATEQRLREAQKIPPVDPAKIAAAQAAFNKLNKEVNGVKAQMQSLEKSGLQGTSAYSQLQEKFAKLKLQLDESAKSLEKLRNPQVDTAKVDQLTAELKRQEAYAERLKKRLAGLNFTGDLDEKIAQANKDLEDTQNEAIKLKEDLDNLVNSPGLDEVANDAKKAKAEIASVSKSASSATGSAAKKSGSADPFKKIAGGMDFVRRGLMNISDAFRFVSQAMVGLGRQMQFFVTLPLVAVFMGMAMGAVNFEDSLVRVQKTSGITSGELSKLGLTIREISKNSATGAVDLAGVAEVIGQMEDWGAYEKAGYNVAGAMASLTQTIDMFAVTTDQAGADVAAVMGQIMNAFGKSMGKSTQDVWRLANVINLLENATAATAPQIQTALAAFAPFAAQLNMTEADAAAYSATLISMGLSAEEAGTSLRNMSEYLIQNADVFSKYMGQVNSDYDSTDKVLKAVETDVSKVFIDMATAASQTGSSTQAMVAILDILKKRGGRAMLLLAQNVDMLKANLGMANAEWASSVSILTEYDKAMSSTKSQLAMLKNNITDAGITIGEAILPVIQQIVQVAVPAIRMLAQWFKSLNKSAQMNVVGIGLLVVALGPLLLLFGSVLNAVTMVIFAFGRLVQVPIMLIGVLGPLKAVIAGVAAAFTSWPVVIVAAVVGVLKVLSMMGVNIAGVFKRMASAATTWGENLAKNIANGFLAGAVRFIYRAISYVANLIASFFESHSPPKAGPLSTIDQWGAALMKTFLAGFKNADFSILSQVSSIIEQTLTRGLDGTKLASALKKLAGARVIISKLISKYNSTGLIDEGMLNQATEGLGVITDNVRQLIRLSLQYNSIQQRIADLDRQQKNAGKVYNDRIALIGASNMSIIDQVEAIRQAKREYDQTVASTEDEKAALEDQADQLKENIDYQQNMIDALSEQEDIFQRIADILKQIAEQNKQAEGDMAGGGAGAGGGGFDIGGGLDDAKKKMDEAAQTVQGIIDRFTEGKKALQGFIDGWNGVHLASWNIPQGKNRDTYLWLYTLGEKAREVKEKVSQAFDGIKKGWDNLKATFTGGSGSFSFGGLLESIGQIQVGSNTLAAAFAPLGQILAFISGLFMSSLGPALERAKEIFGQMNPELEPLRRSLAQLGESFSVLWSILQPYVLPLLQALGILLVGFLITAVFTITAAITAFAQVLNYVVSGLALVASGLITAFSGLVSFFSGIFGAIVGIVTGDKALIVSSFGEMYNGVVQILGGLVTAVYGIIVGVGGSIIAFFGEFVGSIIQSFVDLYVQLTGNTDNGMNNINATLRQGTQAMYDIFVGLVPQLIQAGIDMMAGLRTGVETSAAEVVAYFSNLATEILNQLYQDFGIASPSTVFRDIGINLIQGLIDGITGMVGGVVEAISQIAGTVMDTIKNLLFGGGSDQQSQASGSGFSIDNILPNPDDTSARIALVQSQVIGFIQGVGASFTQLGSSVLATWTSMWSSLMVDVSKSEALIDPFVSSMESAFKKLVKDLGASWNDLWSMLQKTATDSIDLVIKATDKFVDSIASAVMSSGRRLGDIAKAFSSISNSIGTASTGITSFKSKVDGIRTAKMVEVNDIWASVAASVARAATELKRFISQLSLVGNKTYDVRITASGAGASMNMSGTQTSTQWSGSGSVSGKASGGAVVANHIYHINELGQELFIPGSNGRIVPTGMLGHLLHSAETAGPGSIQIVINNPVVRDGVDIRRLADQVASELASKINGQIRFGGHTAY